MTTVMRALWVGLVVFVAACGDDTGGAAATGSGGESGTGTADSSSSGTDASGSGTSDVGSTDVTSSSDASTDAATGSGGAATTGSGASSSAGTGGATSCEQNADACADEADFGELFTASNGRADGTLLAVVGTTDTQCPFFNDDHAVLEVTILGGVQRLVVNVDGVGVATATAPLVGPPFADGWHENVELDYPTDLDLHSDDFEQVTVDGAEAFLCEHLVVGDSISVYAYSDGSAPTSAHQIHYNQSYPDGAIAVDPTSNSPIYLAFRFADQEF